MTNSITESRYGVIDTTNVQGEQYVLNFPGEWRFYVTIDEYNQLRALIDDYLEEPEIRRVREFARLIYGAV